MVTYVWHLFAFRPHLAAYCNIWAKGEDPRLIIRVINFELFQPTLCLKKTGPLLHFQITPTILVQYQQNLVQRIVN